MTQSHLPRTGRGVIEAVIMALQICNLESCLPFRKKAQVFLFSLQYCKPIQFQPHDWHGRACETQPPSGKDIL